MNFTCTIDTRRSFYFNIALNGFLHKMKWKDLPNCVVLCNKQEKTMVHLFCECERGSSIWKALLDL